MSLALEIADERRLHVIHSTAEDVRSSYAQYLTPIETALLAASMFSEANSNLKGLDLGAGTGILSVALFERYCGKISIDAVEYDEMIAHHFRDEAEKVGIRHRLLVQDALLCDDLEMYDRIILNPPYKKMSALDPRMQMLPVRVPNLYAAFLCIAITHLNPGGECVAIIPRSWMNGQYFAPFRKWLLENASIDAMHIYDSRSEVFSDTDVLQETMLIKLSKQSQGNSIAITSLAGRRGNLRRAKYSAKDLIDYQDDEMVIGIEPKASAFSNCQTLSDRLFCASTGKVVDFRAHGYLKDDEGEDCVELVYPCNFSGMRYIHPVDKGKKQWFSAIDDFSRKQLIHSGSYVVVKRFSSKEEKKRIYASYFETDKPIALENHLNFIHCGSPRKVVPLDSLVGKGLAIWLNSTMVDEWFRSISGSTQVNASDLKKLRFLRIISCVKLEGAGQKIFAKAKLIKYARKSCMSKKQRIEQTQQLLRDLGMDDERSNERSAMVFLALAKLGVSTPWKEATNELLGTRAIMDWIADEFEVEYKPNTRETIRRFTLHQFVQGGLVAENVDQPDRPINSPKWNYSLTEDVLSLVKKVNQAGYEYAVVHLMEGIDSWKDKYREERNMLRIPVILPDGEEVNLTAGGQNELIKLMVDEFCPRFVPGGEVLYIDDTGKEAGGINSEKLKEIEAVLPERGKAPDLIVWLESKQWLFLMEACSTHGPIDVTRVKELQDIFGECKGGLVFVSCFPTRIIMQKYLADLAWETEAWCADTPDHMIHLNGSKFLGPYQ